VCPARGRERGITFVELILFIVVVGIGVAGILLVYTSTVRGSADPLVRKQLVAAAEAILEEVQLMPFTFCDPDDPQAATAASTADCTVVEAVGPEPGETRGGNVTPFDNVNDYQGLVVSPITDITGAGMPELAAYSAQISVAQESLNGIPASESLRITVTVQGPGNESFTLSGYRTRYAPNAVP
jgi:MSHA pilin protein MshD